jgi:chromosome segregation ATPase
MSKMYESFKGVVQDKLQRGKNNLIPMAQIKHAQASSLNDEIDELEKLVVQKLSVLKTAVNHGEQTVDKETHDAEEVIQTLRENVAKLSGDLKETEDLARKKESDSQSMKNSLSETIHGLQNDLKKKEEALEIRAKETNDLRFEVESQRKRLVELESAIEQAKTEAVKGLERTEQLTESSKAQIAALESQLRRTEEIVREKDSIVRRLEHELSVKMGEFDSQVTNKEKLLATRDAEIEELKSQLQVLTRGVKDMSSFFRNAEALANVGTQQSTIPPIDQPETEEKKPVSIKDPNLTSSASSAEETVSPEVFNRMTDRLTLIIGPLAPMIIRDHVAALGESMEQFPKSRVAELLELLSKEIANEKMRIAFCEPFKQL